jgi:hypothetical protein
MTHRPPSAQAPARYLDRLPGEIRARLVAATREAGGLFGEPPSLQLLFTDHLALFEHLIRGRATHEILGLLLAELGIHLPDGKPHSEGTISSCLSRARRYAALFRQAPADAGDILGAPANAGNARRAPAEPGTALHQPAARNRTRVKARTRRAPSGRQFPADSGSTLGRPAEAGIVRHGPADPATAVHLPAGDRRMPSNAPHGEVGENPTEQPSPPSTTPNSESDSGSSPIPASPTQGRSRRRSPSATNPTMQAGQLLNDIRKQN